jgi:hypothetical protein
MILIQSVFPHRSTPHYQIVKLSNYLVDIATTMQEHGIVPGVGPFGRCGYNRKNGLHPRHE